MTANHNNNNHHYIINKNKKVGMNVDVGSKPAVCSARVSVACCDWDQCLYNMR